MGGNDSTYSSLERIVFVFVENGEDGEDCEGKVKLGRA